MNILKNKILKNKKKLFTFQFLQRAILSTINISIKHKNNPIVESTKTLTKYQTHSSVWFPIDKKIASKTFIKCARDAVTICFETSFFKNFKI